MLARWNEGKKKKETVNKGKKKRRGRRIVTPALTTRGRKNMRGRWIAEGDGEAKDPWVRRPREGRREEKKGKKEKSSAEVMARKERVKA